MSKIIQCLSLANGEEGPADHWLLSYDPKTGESTWTPHKKLARRFADAFDAMTLLKSVHETKPVRPDGKPNRPLTAFNVVIEDENA